MTSIRIGTRGSPLALWQANWVFSQIQKNFPDKKVSIITIKTTGDQVGVKGETPFGYKGLFIKEIEEALLKGEIDLAVHSMKDMPAEIPSGLIIAAIPKRADPRDLLVTTHGLNFHELKPHTLVGTSSIRRQCQLKRLRHDLKYQELRGNVDTRLRKLESGVCGALVLAKAGVDRLGLKVKGTFLNIIPAVGQGALCLETRKEDKPLQALLQILNHPLDALCVSAERAYLKVMEGGCQVPLACYVKPVGTQEVIIWAFVSNEDGTQFIQREATVQRSLAIQTTERMAHDILADGGRDILDQLKI